MWALVDALPPDQKAGYRALEPLIADASEDDPGIAVEPGDLWTLMYTSGTTGTPKGIQHTHFIRAMYAARANSWRMMPESVVLHSGSIVFNGAMTTMMPAFMLGATFIVERAFDAEAVIATIERERVTHTMLVPSQIIAILSAKSCARSRLESLEMVLSLGAPLHQEYKDRLEALLPRRLYELYGLTEGFITVLDRDDALRKPGSVGVPPPFYSLRIVGDDGRDLPAGEHRRDRGARPDHDARLLQPAGGNGAHAARRLAVHGRPRLCRRRRLPLPRRPQEGHDRHRRRQGLPKDIEEIAARHPAVREVAVFGIPHDKWGETPVAAVVLREKGCARDDELRDWINARVAAKYQRVDRVLVLDEFPRNTAGKTLKRELRAPFWEGRAKAI